VKTDVGARHRQRRRGLARNDLVALRRVLGVAGVIVGKALYEGRFDVSEAVLACAR